MSWRTVVVTQHAKISYSGHCLVVQTQTDTNQIPVSDIQVLLISTTRAVISTAAISELAKNQVKIIFTDGKGEPITETVDYCPNNRDVQTLMKQIGWSEQRKNQLWTAVVKQKIANQIAVLQSLNQDVSELQSELEQVGCNDSTNREAVVAKKYFPKLFDDEFNRRNADVINAALNYGYSLLLSAMNREIVVAGYLTQLGIHHHSSENQFNLGSDLMEPFRPFVDMWVKLQKFNELTPDVKYGLIDLLNLEIIFNGQHMIIRNAITRYVKACLNFLSEETNEIQIEVAASEVSYHEINGHV
ncbi:type II CRISPR-associated endonuclease Cas1 [Lapidilactobacillus mulanensis]|uniref:CRISPR-associated endonuclease Cas1 n=1 Tax=Lapidilactobacillus mulanensis TaxID=2485999 RepID=A0ABW4DQH1_9LACO|nr:type II CRISPR-associated endonuclease Cas1 [Lapidilactobacillus mulanensis]